METSLAVTPAASNVPGTGRPLLVALTWLAHAVLGIGLVAPSMTFVGRMGPWTEIARSTDLLPAPETYSVLSGILALFSHGNVLVGGVLLLFSVLFPVAKLVVVRLALVSRGKPRLLHAVGILSKYSMIDVFVMALLVVASRTMPGGSEIRLEWGLAAFGTAALLSMVLAGAARKEAAAPRRAGDPGAP